MILKLKFQLNVKWFNEDLHISNVDVKGNLQVWKYYFLIVPNHICITYILLTNKIY